MDVLVVKSQSDMDEGYLAERLQSLGAECVTAHSHAELQQRMDELGPRRCQVYLVYHSLDALEAYLAKIGEWDPDLQAKTLVLYSTGSVAETETNHGNTGYVCAEAELLLDALPELCRVLPTEPAEIVDILASGPYRSAMELLTGSMDAVLLDEADKWPDDVPVDDRYPLVGALARYAQSRSCGNGAAWDALLTEPGVPYRIELLQRTLGCDDLKQRIAPVLEGDPAARLAELTKLRNDLLLALEDKR